jgi:hypothetical protein
VQPSWPVASVVPYHQSIYVQFALYAPLLFDFQFTWKFAPILTLQNVVRFLHSDWLPEF